MSSNTLHVAAFPWFALGHITPFLHLSNKLAERGCKVSFFVPTKTIEKLKPLNLHPHLIHFIPLTVPQVEGLPAGAETMSDVPLQDFQLLIKAFDLTKDQVKNTIHNLHLHAILFDFARWIPKYAHSLGIKCIFFSVINISVMAPLFLQLSTTHPSSEENEEVVVESEEQSDEGWAVILTGSDAMCFRGYQEFYGNFCDQLKSHFNKPVLLVGTNLPEPSNAPLEERWGEWLGGFEKGSVVYCAFGSECVLEKDQFQELLLGLELTGLPFLARLEPPKGVETVEEALPEGFQERVGGRGVVHGGWVQQQQILNNPSVGCFVSHCGYGSMWESLVSSCQIVLIPHVADQFENANYMAKELKVGVEVERREEDKWFTREGVSKAVKSAMEEGSEVGEEIRANHNKWREFLSTKGLESTYLDNFLVELKEILK